jgi:hypothetical protein
MQRQQGDFAEWYKRTKRRSGAISGERLEREVHLPFQYPPGDEETMAMRNLEVDFSAAPREGCVGADQTQQLWLEDGDENVLVVTLLTMLGTHAQIESGTVAFDGWSVSVTRQSRPGRVG